MRHKVYSYFFSVAFGFAFSGNHHALAKGKAPLNNRTEDKLLGLFKVTPLIGWDTKKGACPEAKKFADDLATLKLFDEKAKEKFPKAIYNSTVLAEIRKIHEDLEFMRHKTPPPSWAKSRGGGYRYLRTPDEESRGIRLTGLRVPIELGRPGMANYRKIEPLESEVPHCSGASFTVLARVLGGLDGGLIFEHMSREQVDNFDPKRMGEIFDGERLKEAEAKRVAKEKKSTRKKSKALSVSDLPFVSLDDHGAHGTVDNNGEGFRDLNRRMGEHTMTQSIKALGDAAPGDFMQFDRKSPSGGHAGIFLGSLKGKAYYWSANAGTQGYGVTCDSESNIRPRVERLVSPYSAAAIPAYTGKAFFGADEEKKTQSKFELLKFQATIAKRPRKVVEKTREGLTNTVTEELLKSMNESEALIEEAASAQHSGLVEEILPALPAK